LPDLNDNADLAESFLKYIFRALLNERSDDLKFFADRIDKGCIARLERFVASSFARMTYTDAIAALEKSGKKFEFPVRWGIDLQSEHERWLTEEHVKAPIVVMNYPKEIKAFYMRMNDDQKTVAAMDVSRPGIGEIIGGSQREERLDCLDRRLAELNLDASPLRLVSRPAPLWDGAPRRIRPRPRADDHLRDRDGQHPRRDSISADSRQRVV
jgi:asparaginyl-tRNA synthetase